MEEELTEEELAERRTRELDKQLKVLIDQCAQKLRVKVPIDGAFAPSQRRVLCMLAERGEMTQQRLLDELELAPASLSEVVSKLAEKGLATREKLESDKRIMVVALTPAGRAAAEGLLAAEDAATSSAFARLTLEEKQQLEELLRKIV